MKRDDLEQRVLLVLLCCIVFSLVAVVFAGVALALWGGV